MIDNGEVTQVATVLVHGPANLAEHIVGSASTPLGHFLSEIIE